MKKIVIIGGGASGMVAAISAKKENNEVIILEKNNILGKKILATGNGRCNYFNEIQDVSKYSSTTPKLLKEIISIENINMVLDFFNSLGIIPKIKNGYYYPYSNKSENIKKILEDKIKDLGIKVKYNFNIEDISYDNKFIIKGNDIVEADSLIISTGGMASPITGSTGDGYDFAKKFNHTIIKPRPALTYLKGNDKLQSIWAGIRVDAKVSLICDDEVVDTEEGELQLTKNGLSGICIFNLSTRAIEEEAKSVEIGINFMPFIEPIMAVEFFRQRKEENCIKVLEGFLNLKLIKAFTEILNIKEDAKIEEVDIPSLIKLLTDYRFKVEGHGSFEDSQTTSGGVSLEEVNRQTFASLKQENLYLTGELLDVSGKCGGYNLTFAWISGISAGLDASIN